MTTEELIELFKKHEDEYLKPTSHPSNFSQRCDLHAFILLDTLCPNKRDIVSAAEHDEIYIGVDLEELAKVATEDNVITLIRCGVMLDEETESLKMFC